MSSAFLGNYVNRRRQFTKVKVNRWLSSFFPDVKKQDEHFNVCMHHSPIYEITYE